MPFRCLTSLSAVWLLSNNVGRTIKSRLELFGFLLRRDQATGLRKSIPVGVFPHVTVRCTLPSATACPPTHLSAIQTIHSPALPHSSACQSTRPLGTHHSALNPSDFDGASALHRRADPMRSTVFRGVRDIND